jgi:hypothetical protein
MGGREWAQGSVYEVAERFRKMEPLTSRIWSMKLFSVVFQTELPILILQTDSGRCIDDGSHRAIAMALSGLDTASAWIGYRISG